MKTRIIIYSIFGGLSILGIALYLINPAVVFFQVSMSFGASLIGAIFVAVTLEAINNSKQKHSVKAIQTHLLSSIKQSFKSFYIWLGNYLVRKFEIVNFKFEEIDNSNKLFSKLFDECNNKIANQQINVDLEKVINFISTRTTPLLESIEKLNQIINEEIATLITNEVLDEDDVEYFNDLKTHLLDAQECDNFEELSFELNEILAKLNTKQMLNLGLDDLLTDRLIRKFSMPK